MANYEKVTIDNVTNGALVDLFDEGWQKIMDNIADINVKADETREMQLIIKVRPGKSAENANVKCSMKLKLASVEPYEHFVVLSKKGGKVEAFTTDPNQSEFGFEEDPGKVLNIGGNPSGR